MINVWYENHYQSVTVYNRSSEIFILILAQAQRIRPGEDVEAAEFKAGV